jgi:hypothetical protein
MNPAKRIAKLHADIAALNADMAELDRDMVAALAAGLDDAPNGDEPARALSPPSLRVPFT